MKQHMISAMQLSLRAGISAAIGLAVARLLQLQYPIYALVAAVIVTDLSPAQTRHLGIQRLVGTVVGATLGALFSYVLPAGPFAIGASITSSMFMSHLLKISGAAKISGYVSGIVMLEHQENQWAYALFRLIETVLGIVAAILISMVPRIIKEEPSNPSL